jgi:hypothetical protein
MDAIFTPILLCLATAIFIDLAPGGNDEPECEVIWVYA